MKDPIAVRPARPDDAPLAAAVIHLAMGAFGDYLFGPNARQAEIALMRLFSADAGRFGYSRASVVEKNRQALGLMLAFPGAEMESLTWPLVRSLPRAFGWSVFGFVSRALAFIHAREAEADEFYVSVIGVLPAAQGQGLGKRLLLHADAQARALGLSKVSLIVSPENHAAQRLYARNGFKIVSTWQDKNPLASYHRMVKQIG